MVAVALREVGAERPPLRPPREYFLLLPSLSLYNIYNVFQILKVLFDSKLSLRTRINLRV